MSWSERGGRVFYKAHGLAAALGAAELVIFVLALNPTASPAYRAFYIDRTTTCLDREVEGSYALGDTVSFRPDGARQAAKLKVCGLSRPVGNGTHSLGDTSRIRVAAPAYGPFLAVFELSAVLRAPATAQRVSFSVNGVPAFGAVITDPDRQAVSFPIPEATVESAQMLDFELSYPDAFQPHKLSSDTNKRAVRLLSFKLDVLRSPKERRPENTQASACTIERACRRVLMAYGLRRAHAEAGVRSEGLKTTELP